MYRIAIILVLAPFAIYAQHNTAVDSLTNLLQTPISDEQKVDVMVALADEYGASDSTLWVRYSEDAMQLAQQIGYDKGLVDASYMRAAMDMTFGYIHSAAKGFQQVVDLARKIDYPAGEAKGLNGLGATRDFQGDYSGALEYLFAAVRINERLGDLRSASSRYNNIGLVYYSQEDFSNAILYFRKALDVYEKINLQSSIALVNGNMGELFLKVGDIHQAESHFLAALQLYSRLGEPYGVANMHRNLGEVQHRKGVYTDALSYFDSALTAYETLGRGQFQAQTLIGMGITYYEKQEWSTAKQHLRKGVTLSEELDHILSIRDGWEYLALVEEALGNHKAALDAQKKFKNTADEILNTEQTRSLTRQHAEFEFQNERDSLAFAQQRATFDLEQQVQRQNSIVILVIIIASFLGIIAFLSYRSFLTNKRKKLTLEQKNKVIKLKHDELIAKNEEISDLRESEKKMAEEAIALKERELTTVTLLSHEKNALLQQLNAQISELSKKVDEDVIPELKDIRKVISTNLNEESWSIFTHHFEKVHPKFFNTLKTAFSALTQHDLRLCAYLRVGMSNKEIANISNITPDAVKKSLNRMKKKMSLGVETDLRDFLMDL